MPPLGRDGLGCEHHVAFWLKKCSYSFQLQVCLTKNPFYAVACHYNLLKSTYSNSYSIAKVLKAQFVKTNILCETLTRTCPLQFGAWTILPLLVATINQLYMQLHSFSKLHLFLPHGSLLCQLFLCSIATTNFLLSPTFATQDTSMHCAS